MKRNQLTFLSLAVILFSIKTYIVYLFIFEIVIESPLQHLILFINPFITTFIFLGLSVWFTNYKNQLKFIRYAVLIGTIILFFNIVFHRSFTDYITIPQLFQTSNFTDLSTSVFSLIQITDILLFLDVFIIWYIARRYLDLKNTFIKREKVLVTLLSLLLMSGNFLLAEIARPQLLTKAFDREYLVKNIGLFNYHIYDIGLQSKNRAQKVFADGNDLRNIKTYINENIRSNQESELFGIGEGKNVIFISAESVQSFVINARLHGEEITPFLNELVEDEDTFYFDNFYHQTEQGKTSDSEFIVENSLYPLPGGAAFFTHSENTYHSFSEMIEEKDYKSHVFHANTNTFWNRNQMYESLKIDNFFDANAYEINEDDAVGWGLKDKVFFDQTITHLKELEVPYYAKLITITNHYPFELTEEDRTLEPYDSKSSTLNGYFSTVRYTDEAIGLFFEQLKAEGLYEDSIIVIMGDHDGISANHYKSLAGYLNKEEITPYDNIQLQRVPFYIHIPGFGDGEVKSIVSGQIDVKPTLLHLLGIETNHDIYFGNDLFHDERKDVISRRNGDFVSRDYIYTNETCYERGTGEIIEDSTLETSPCFALQDEVERELEFSDMIVYGDLFRFINFEKK